MKNKSWLCIYTIIHFIVDLACIYFMTGIMIPLVADHDKWLFLAVLYNMLAFALPMLLGLLADSYKKNAVLAAIGCFFVTVAYIVFWVPFLPVIFLGIGNGLFHIGGGRQVLLNSKDKYAPCGIFISSGALGVYFGSFWGRGYYPVWTVTAVIVFACAVFLWILRKKEKSVLSGKLTENPIKSEYIGKRMYAAFLLLMIVVCIRSYYGTIQNFSWKNGFWVGLIFTLCIVGGKFFGGVLADLLGIRKTIVISLGLAGVLAFFAFDSVIAGCASIFFFNMTMPLTLSRMFQMMPDKPGFAFGSLMFALFLGTLPTMLYNVMWMCSPMGLLTLCLISLAALLWEARTAGKGVKSL